MKNEIKLAAQNLIALYGSTTNLDVKNHIHAEKNDPNFSLTQREVSKAMQEIADEEKWDINFNGSFKTFSFGPNTIHNSTPSNSSYFGKSALDPIVAYVRVNPKMYATGKDKNEARRKAFLLANSAFSLGITYDDLNVCTAEYYNKKYK